MNSNANEISSLFLSQVVTDSPVSEVRSIKLLHVQIMDI